MVAVVFASTVEAALLATTLTAAFNTRRPPPRVPVEVMDRINPEEVTVTTYWPVPMAAVIPVQPAFWPSSYMARERPASAAYWAAAASPALKATEISVKVELPMATPTTVSSTTRTNTAAMAEPRSLCRCACRVPALRPEPAKPAWGFPRSRVPVSMNISVAAGPGEWDHERTCRRCGEGGGKVLH